MTWPRLRTTPIVVAMSALITSVRPTIPTSSPSASTTGKCLTRFSADSVKALATGIPPER